MAKKWTEQMESVFGAGATDKTMVEEHTKVLVGYFHM